ncbi:MAG: DUF393 domain-containing protein [Gammaproteobacteria bacterium]|nr:DUF393 domain-containing protein [Gammaproteobacteria bacterium]
MNTTPQTVYIIYDGDCPFCSNCAKALRIKETIGSLKLINAREENIQSLLNGQQFDLNEGMLVIMEGKYYHGAQAAYILSLLSTRVGLFNKLNFLLFHKLFLARMLYPVFRGIRNVILKFKGISPIE